MMDSLHWWELSEAFESPGRVPSSFTSCAACNGLLLSPIFTVLDTVAPAKSIINNKPNLNMKHNKVCAPAISSELSSLD